MSKEYYLALIISLAPRSLEIAKNMLNNILSLWCFIALILTKQMVIADDDHCTDFQFKSPFLPGESCEGIYAKNPESHAKSGYYWILSREYCGMTYTGSSCEDIYNNNPETGDKSGYYHINDKWVYCNMKEIATSTYDFISSCAGVGGRWRKIASLNITAGDDCPIGWMNATVSGVSFCQKSLDGRGCNSTIFPVNGIQYQKVCGRARGYQKGHPTGGFYGDRKEIIDGLYVDGLSITYLYNGSRQHIWTYATGDYDSRSTGGNCPCASYSGKTPPFFVGDDYYCESGRGSTDDHSVYHFDDPLWDGSGCITSNCCTNPMQPWFYRELNETTTSDVEVRLCDVRSFSAGFTMIDQMEIYIQ